MIGIPRLALALGRFMLAPNNPAYRFMRATDENARTVIFHQVCFALLVGVSIVLPVFNALNGILRDELRPGFWFNFFVHAYIGAVHRHYREGLDAILLGHDRDIIPFEERCAQLFPYFAILMAVLI